jgi:hypothetical protein
MTEKLSWQRKIKAVPWSEAPLNPWLPLPKTTARAFHAFPLPE